MGFLTFRFDGVYVAHSSKEDILCTRNYAPGCTVYGEKVVSVDKPVGVELGFSRVRVALERRWSTDSGTPSVPSLELLFW